MFFFCILRFLKQTGKAYYRIAVSYTHLSAIFPEGEEEAIPSRVARLSEDMMEFAEEPRAVVILDEDGKPLTAGDTERRFFEASWMHKYNGKYYFSYSTGDTHLLCYATCLLYTS